MTVRINDKPGKYHVKNYKFEASLTTLSILTTTVNLSLSLIFTLILSFTLALIQSTSLFLDEEESINPHSYDVGLLKHVECSLIE
jgi:hypothetical protein